MPSESKGHRRKIVKMTRRMSQGVSEGIQKIRRKKKYENNDDLEDGTDNSEKPGCTTRYFSWFILFAIITGFVAGWSGHIGFLKYIENVNPNTVATETPATMGPGVSQPTKATTTPFFQDPNDFSERRVLCHLKA